MCEPLKQYIEVVQLSKRLLERSNGLGHFRPGLIRLSMERIVKVARCPQDPAELVQAFDGRFAKRPSVSSQVPLAMGLDHPSHYDWKTGKGLGRQGAQRICPDSL